MGVLNETGTAYHSLAPGFTPEICFIFPCHTVNTYVHDEKVIYLIHDSKYQQTSIDILHMRIIIYT